MPPTEPPNDQPPTVRDDTTVAGDYCAHRADDPIPWQPWDSRTLTRAAAGSRPILLLIGSATCRWCRRLGRPGEAFADPDVAALLKERFVPVCVDRLRRPDVDRVYQNAFQLLNGRPGGWPLLLVLTPDDRLPFFAAGYLPPQGGNGLPPPVELLTRLADFLRDHEDQVRAQNATLAGALRAGPSRHGASGYSLRPAVLDAAIDRLKQQFDPTHGGFEGGLRHPHAPKLDRLLRHYWHTRQEVPDTRKTPAAPGESDGRADTRAGFIAKFTLEKLADSPLHAAAGGFYRAAAGVAGDDPEPERPLADNAALLTLYAQTWRLTGSRRCRDVARLTADWLLRLQRDDGGFCSALAEDPVDGPLLDRRQRIAGTAAAAAALAVAGRHLDAPALVEAAERAVDGLRRRHWRDGRLHNRFETAGDDAPAWLDDYLYLLAALLELLQCRWCRADLTLARTLAGTLLRHYQEPGRKGGFYFTADDQEPLIQRPRPIYDDALPALNGLAAQLLIRLGHWENALTPLLAAERALKNAWPSLERSLAGCCGMLLGLEEYFFPSDTVLLRGPAARIEPWRATLAGDYAPRRLVLALPDEDAPPDADLPALLAGTAGRTSGRTGDRAPRPAEGTARAYLLRRRRRHGPYLTPEQLRRALADAPAPSTAPAADD